MYEVSKSSDKRRPKVKAKSSVKNVLVNFAKEKLVCMNMQCSATAVFTEFYIGHTALLWEMVSYRQNNTILVFLVGT